MTQEKVIKVTANYRDPGLLERIAANFRKFWVDIKWMNAECNDENECTVYLSLYDRYNLGNMNIAIMTLSKTVDVDNVEVLEDYNVNKFNINFKKSEKYEWGELVG
ncbi:MULTISPECIES: ACT domain-containing protein [Acidiplasma]|uniref:Uncharacterized protein n=3 Tax=Acidiplasma TaxID=507753 RepID=A0A0N8VKM1_9ARCH|nr:MULTISPECIES: hypothetical protein [Acidiplasma]KJE49118.1 hypothetical protein TZ01_03220 [Acidiplasma sp. MBA-1]KPV45074.1 hypothetical protein SE19_08400 [Acidiplasma aeolicum]KQB33701.1 hypothetical protein AOG54_06675 [Acidiplasma aeolicum]KQB34108.1 hypothetical protein AOG55_01445 [Acidiplasma cupricumulans]WMT54948.1 MAG: hypothetical protein RE470_08545 [Acidiplasma sp.]